MDLKRLDRRTDASTLGSMKPGKYDQKHGKYDQKHQVRITGAELRELKRLDMPESLGLDQRIQRFSGDASHRLVPLGSGVPMSARMARSLTLLVASSQGE